MKKRFLGWSLGLFSLALALSSCLDNDVPPPPDYDLIMRQGLSAVDKTQLAKDNQIIDDSLARWGTTNVKVDSIGGVRYVITPPVGTGTVATTSGAVVAVNYKMRLLQDYQAETTPHKPIIDQNNNFQINLYNLILGWQTAFRELPAGTKAVLYVPSGLGYGKTDRKNPNTGAVVIPANSNLIFEIDVIQVVNP